MLIGHTIAKHQATDIISYQLIQNDVVGMGERDGVFSYTIWKCDKGEMKKRVADGIKNKDAIDLIWADVCSGIQK